MGVTNFPDGINVGSADGGTAVLQLGGAEVGVPVAQLRKAVGHVTTAGRLVAAGTVVVPAGAAGTAFASGLTTVQFVVAGNYGDGPAATYIGAHATWTGGSITLYGQCAAGTASTASGTAVWWAIGA